MIVCDRCKKHIQQFKKVRVQKVVGELCMNCNVEFEHTLKKVERFAASIQNVLEAKTTKAYLSGAQVEPVKADIAEGISKVSKSNFDTLLATKNLSNEDVKQLWNAVQEVKKVLVKKKAEAEYDLDEDDEECYHDCDHGYEEECEEQCEDA